VFPIIFRPRINTDDTDLFPVHAIRADPWLNFFAANQKKRRSGQINRIIFPERLFCPAFAALADSRSLLETGG